MAHKNDIFKVLIRKNLWYHYIFRWYFERRNWCSSRSCWTRRRSWGRRWTCSRCLKTRKNPQTKKHPKNRTWLKKYKKHNFWNVILVININSLYIYISYVKIWFFHFQWKKILFILLLDHFLFAKFIEFCQHYNIAIFPLKCSYWLLQYLKL